MNQIEQLQQRLSKEYPMMRSTLSKPRWPNGIWWLDIALEGAKRLTVEWNGRHFGLSGDTAEGLGEDADEKCIGLDAIYGRLQEALTKAEQPSPPRGVLLARLREKRGISQTSLARKLGIKQSTLSGIEHRDDVMLSTLNRIVKALGGTLCVYADFPEGRFRLGAAVADSVSAQQGLNQARVPLERDLEDKVCGIAAFRISSGGNHSGAPLDHGRDDGGGS
jgi:transcriptional regulator with XRE-family HTH domain